MSRGLPAACALCLMTLWLAGCGFGDDAPPPTATPEPPAVLQIVTPTPGTPPPAERPRRATDRYVVQPGDSLFDIAVQFGVSIDELREANGIEDPDSIYAGQVLTIPRPADEP